MTPVGPRVAAAEVVGEPSSAAIVMSLHADARCARRLASTVSPWQAAAAATTTTGAARRVLDLGGGHCPQSGARPVVGRRGITSGTDSRCRRGVEMLRTDQTACPSVVGGGRACLKHLVGSLQLAIMCVKDRQLRQRPANTVGIRDAERG